MSARNHHVKSLGHSPDLIGMFFSILDQFSNTAHFVDKGRLIRVNTETFELSGSNLVAKVFAGFMNWLGHLFSDMAGSSGGRGNPSGGRGSGIPIPFYSLLQFLNVGAFGQHRQTFSTIAVKVFESGYDLRHGLAMAIPVLITELLTRMMWVVKRRYYHNQDWSDLRSNVIAWARFGTLAIKEVNAIYKSGALDVEAVDSYLDAEMERLIR